MKSTFAATSLSAVLLLTGCAAMKPQPYVVADLQPTRGNTASGTVWFIQEGPQVLIKGRVAGLKPNQQHGFHVHEKGDCSSGDGMSTGGHLNPGGKPHGPPDAAHHAGDVPSLQADANGVAVIRVLVDGKVLGSDPGAFAGKGLIVHAGPDDYTTQPTGNSGARIACAVIGTVAGADSAGRRVALPDKL